MPDSTTCVVCDELADDKTASDCSSCGERFHLNQRNDREGKDCGSVWINEQHLALEFACQRCLDLSGAPPPEPAGPEPTTRRRRYRKRA